MSDEVQVFYAELNAASSALSSATTELLTEAANIVGDDTGVENPAQRAGLRLEFHRRMTALHDAAYNRIEAADDVAVSISDIANKYTELDAELTGGEN